MNEQEIDILYDNLTVEKKNEKYKNYTESKFDFILKDLQVIMPEGSSLLEVLRCYAPWYKVVNQLRNEDEHGQSSLESLLNYELKENNHIRYLDRPRFQYKPRKSLETVTIYVNEFLKASLEYQLNFCELVILLSLIEYLPDQYVIAEIPEEQRDPQYPRKFKASLTGQEEFLWQQAGLQLILTLRQLLEIRKRI